MNQNGATSLSNGLAEGARAITIIIFAQSAGLAAAPGLPWQPVLALRLSQNLSLISLECRRLVGH